MDDKDYGTWGQPVGLGWSFSGCRLLWEHLGATVAFVLEILAAQFSQEPTSTVLPRGLCPRPFHQWQAPLPLLPCLLPPPKFHPASLATKWPCRLIFPVSVEAETVVWLPPLFSLREDPEP